MVDTKFKVIKYDEHEDGIHISILIGEEELNFNYLFNYDFYGKCSLIDYFKSNGDGTKLKILGSFDNDILVCGNYNVHRTIMTNEEGFVTGDTIRYSKDGVNQEYKNKNLVDNTKLKEYLTSDSKKFENEKGEVFVNNVVEDKNFERFLELDEKYSKVVGSVLMDLKKEHEELVKKVSKRIEDKISHYSK